MADLKDWSTNDSDNGALSEPDGPNSGWTGSQVGPWARRTMATVAEWYKDPAWVNPMENIANIGDKTVVRASANTVTVASVSGSINSSATEYFPVGRMIRLTVQGGGAKIHAFVMGATVGGAGPSLTLTLGLLGQSEIVNGTNFVNNGIEVYGGQSAETTANDLQALGAIAFSGTGTTAERDALYAMTLTNYPDGLLWFNTTDDLMQVKRGGSWLDFAAFKDNFDDNGRIFEINATASSAPSPSIRMYGGHNFAADIRGYERNENDDDWHSRGIIYFSTEGDSTIIEGAREDDDGVVGPFARIKVHGAGSSTPGKLSYVYYTWDSSSPPALQSGISHNLTPGELDAGTLNNLNANTIIHRSMLVDGYKWKMSGSPFPAGDGTTLSEYVALPAVGSGVGPRVEFARFAFPPELIAELGVGNTYDMTFDFAISSNTRTNAAGVVRVAVYLGDNYGNTSTTITNYPTGGADAEFDTESTSASPSWGDGEDVTTIRGTITADYGMALAVGNTGQNSTSYARIHDDVPAANSEIAMETRVIFTPVPATRYVANDFQSDAQ